MKELAKIRNIGISAHIDSGKTTLTERMLYYAGRIHRMREVKGGDGGATMDFMELERERGITIASAATQVEWDGHVINVIDTPGHVDFTVEVERSLRVLDGAVMVLCAVGGVQSQSITVDRQMKRYGVPRIAFVNKMDRIGADPRRVCLEMAEKLGLKPVLIQLNMGVGQDFVGVVDLVDMQAVCFDGDDGLTVRREAVPAEHAVAAVQARAKMLDALSLFSDELTERLLDEKDVPSDLIRDALRQATIDCEIVPVLWGAAYRNQGVQPVLDAVCQYLPSPLDRPAFARDHDNGGAEVPLSSDPAAPMVAMAFKVVEERFGQLTYMRVYQGTLEKGRQYLNVRTNRSQRIGRIVRMHADHRQEIESAGPGDIIAMVAVDCASGDTFCDERINYSLESIFVADPVISLSVAPASSADQDRMVKALNRFMKEDPTFRVATDGETGDTIISGMGELHLEVYVERMRREYGANVVVGAPKVSYREAPTKEAAFDYKHKKQTGGSGQYAHVVGRLVPLGESVEETYEFEDNVSGGRIPREYIPAVNKGFKHALRKGPLAGYEIVGCKMCLDDGTYHDVDSSEMAFRIAAEAAFRQAFLAAGPVLLEPLMAVEVETPGRFQGAIVGDLNARRGVVHATENRGSYALIRAQVPLAAMFGYATVVRGLTQGMGTFSMELVRYGRVPARIAEEIIAARRAESKTGRKQ
jgi:elongation factor G